MHSKHLTVSLLESKSLGSLPVLLSCFKLTKISFRYTAKLLFETPAEIFPAFFCCLLTIYISHLSSLTVFYLIISTCVGHIHPTV